MNSFRKSGLVAFCLLGLLATAAAQGVKPQATKVLAGKPVRHGAATPVERAQDQTQQLKRDFKLTPAQESRVFQINLEAAQKRGEMAYMKGSTAGDNAAKTIRAEQSQKIRAVLTPSQQAQWDIKERKLATAR